MNPNNYEVFVPITAENIVPGYEISNLGNIRSSVKFKTPTLLKPDNSNSHGYLQVSLLTFRGLKTFLVHRLMCMTFYANPENKAQVNHKNGNKLDNRVENLEWVTPKENVHHSIAIGLFKVGEEAGRAVLKEVDVLKIRQLHATGLTCTEIRDEFPQVTVRNINLIVNKKRWKTTALLN